MKNFINYYDILKIDLYASKNDIKLAYKKISNINPSSKIYKEGLKTLINNEKRFVYNAKLYQEKNVKDIEIGFNSKDIYNIEFEYFEINKKIYNQDISHLKNEAINSSDLFSFKTIILGFISILYILIFVRFEIIKLGWLHNAIYNFNWGDDSYVPLTQQNFPYLVYFGSIVFIGALLLISIGFLVNIDWKTFFSKKIYNTADLIGYSFERKEIVQNKQKKNRKTSIIFYNYENKIFYNKISYKLYCKLMKNNIKKLDILVKKNSCTINKNFIRKIKKLS